MDPAILSSHTGQRVSGQVDATERVETQATTRAILGESPQNDRYVHTVRRHDGERRVGEGCLEHDEGVGSLGGYGGIFWRNVQASGVIPQISVILGPCAGGAVYSPAMTDFIFMVREHSHMFITGPDVVKTVTGEEVTLEELGGAGSHSTKSGVATFVSNSEEEVLDEVKYLLSFLPSNNLEHTPVVETGDDPARLCPELDEILPESSNVPYDMRQVIGAVVDRGDYMEYHSAWGKSITCGFARVDGRAVGVVGNQPMILAGVLDIESAEKAARFVQIGRASCRERG